MCAVTGTYGIGNELLNELLDASTPCVCAGGSILNINNINKGMTINNEIPVSANMEEDFFHCTIVTLYVRLLTRILKCAFGIVRVHLTFQTGRWVLVDVRENGNKMHWRKYVLVRGLWTHTVIYIYVIPLFDLLVKKIQIHDPQLQKC